MKNNFILLGSVIATMAGYSMHAMELPMPRRMAEITFINTTHHDIQGEISRRGAGEVIRFDLPKENFRDGRPGRAKLEPLNLNDFDTFTLTYTHGLRYFYSRTLKIPAVEIDQKLANHNASVVDITIKPWTVLGVLGFAEPSYNFLQGPSKTTESNKLQDTLMGTVIGVKERIPQSIIDQEIYKVIGEKSGRELSSQPTPYEILGMKPFTPEEERDKREASMRDPRFIADDLTKVEKKYKELKNKLEAGSFERDLRKHQTPGIVDFTKKAQDKIYEAYATILKNIGGKLK